MKSQTTKNFTVAILADIHGNLAALDAVLADLTMQTYDTLVIAGDLVMNGPHPAETLAKVQTLNVPTIFGNADREVVEARPDNPIAWWTRAQLSKESIGYLERLSFSHRVTPPQGRSPEDDLLIVHATPTDVVDVLILEPHPLGTTFTTITPAAEAIRMLGTERANLIVYGHIHYVSAGMVQDQRIMSIGSVGFPFDGNPAAAYALVTWNGHDWQVTHRRVPYDYESVIAAIYRSGQPFPDTYAQRLREADWRPQPRL
jgi:predicted phosphodiesterase